MLEFKKYKTPTCIVFFVTNRCNLKCCHCFLWRELNIKTDELSLEHIGKFASSLKTPAFFCLTGGEAILRDDLLEIVEILHQRNQTSCIDITTNGFDTARIYEVASDILEKTILKELHILVSLDGLEETHDRIRGVSGSFNRAIETIENLCALKRKYSNLNIRIFTVIMKQNYKEIEDLIKFSQKFRTPHGFAVVRGRYSVFNLDEDICSEVALKDEENTALSVDELDTLLGKMYKLDSSLEYSPLQKSDLYKLKMTSEILKAKKRIIRCYAGIIDGVIYANGDVGLCETAIPVGNLEETSYDFYKLWNFRKSNKMRKRMKTCACIHGCNLSNSIAFGGLMGN